jgi:ATP-dependent Clp protease ATP-binding subunit ClpA
LPGELPALLGRKAGQKGGARQIRRLVQEQVEGPLALYLLKSGKKTAKIKIKLENETISFQS